MLRAFTIKSYRHVLGSSDRACNFLRGDALLWNYFSTLLKIKSYRSLAILANMGHFSLKDEKVSSKEIFSLMNSIGQHRITVAVLT